MWLFYESIWLSTVLSNIDFALKALKKCELTTIKISVDIPFYNVGTLHLVHSKCYEKRLGPSEENKFFADHLQLKLYWCSHAPSACPSCRVYVGQSYNAWTTFHSPLSPSSLLYSPLLSLFFFLLISPLLPYPPIPCPLYSVPLDGSNTGGAGILEKTLRRRTLA